MKVLAIILTMILFCSNLLAEDFKVVLADYKPYSWFDKKTNEVRGIEVDILKEIIQKRLNIPLDIKILPWKRAQLHVQQGKADAFIAVPTEKRLSYTIINKEPILTWGTSFFINKSEQERFKRKDIHSIDDIKSLKTTSMIGNGWAEKNLEGLDVQWVTQMEQMISLLYKNRVDIIVDSPIVMKYYIKALGLQDDIIELKNYFNMTMYLSVSKKSKYLMLLPLFDKELKAMKEDGSLEKIILSYQ